MPIAVDLGADRRRPAPARPVALPRRRLGKLLFVGRIAPNKRIEDHIRLAEHYKRYVDAYYRFIFVGKTDAVPGYYKEILALMREYDMPHDRFFFTGPVPDADLAAFYRHADVYISLSEHEGFCVPLLESMAADVPVLAYGEAAVPETMGGAGVVFNPKDLEFAAEWLGVLAYDRRRIVLGQRERLADFGDHRTARELDGSLRSSPDAHVSRRSTRAEGRVVKIGPSSSATAPTSSAAPSTMRG